MFVRFESEVPKVSTAVAAEGIRLLSDPALLTVSTRPPGQATLIPLDPLFERP